VLYASSNAGSFFALLAYPAMIEPLAALGTQRAMWSIGYVMLAILMGLAGAPLVFRVRPAPYHAGSGEKRSPWRWLALSAVPSALMLASTTFVTTDVAPAPLLWVIPLALYLASLVVPFTSAPIISHEKVLAALPVAILALGFTMLVGAERLILFGAFVHFGSMFLIALACHGELARTRPPPSELTRFYLVVSVGGAIGGIFCALLAPVLFPGVWEYPLAVSAACALRIGMPIVGEVEPETRRFEDVAKEIEHGMPPKKRRTLWREIALPIGMGVLLVASLRAVQFAGDDWRFLFLAQIGTAACVVAWWMRQRPLRFALLASVILLSPEIAGISARALFRGRSFFAAHRVAADGDRHLYVQGTTIHGLQSTDPAKRRVAGAYFHATGPAGEVLTHIAPRRVGLIGLGVGSLATYAEAGQDFLFYEIDPIVARIAEDPSLFSFVSDARERGASVRIELGDARLLLASADDGSFDMIVLDAYSSDVVPTHLLTREALALYLRKLAPGGIVMMNMSNRYLDLGRVVRALADDAHLVAWERLDEIDTEEDRRASELDGKAVSRWMLLARDEAALRAIGLSGEWHVLASKKPRLWTDEYASVLSCFRF
jgi:spermidine synthase